MGQFCRCDVHLLQCHYCALSRAIFPFHVLYTKTVALWLLFDPPATIFCLMRQSILQKASSRSQISTSSGGTNKWHSPPGGASVWASSPQGPDKMAGEEQGKCSICYQQDPFLMHRGNLKPPFNYTSVPVYQESWMEGVGSVWGFSVLVGAVVLVWGPWWDAGVDGWPRCCEFSEKSKVPDEPEGRMQCSPLASPRDRSRTEQTGKALFHSHTRPTGVSPSGLRTGHWVMLTQGEVHLSGVHLQGSGRSELQLIAQEMESCKRRCSFFSSC